MRILLLLFILCFVTINSFATTIVSAEYFIDTDPGHGNGTSLTGTFGGLTATASLSGISTSGFSFGTHIVYVRFKDSNNNWGESSAVFLNVGNQESGIIVSAEYFIDTDPGQGNGFALNGKFGGSVATAYLSNISTSGLSYGHHNMYVRFKDSNDNWGDVGSKTILISTGQYALFFNGVDNYVSFGNDESLDITDEITVCLWVKPEEMSDNNYVIRKGNIYLLHWDDDYEDIAGKGFQIKLPGTNSGWWEFHQNINYEEWYYISWTYSSIDQSIKSYVNGNLTREGTISGNISTNTDELFIASIENDQRYHGIIDELRIWKRILTEEELQDRMYRELIMTNPADTTDLVGYWDFNEGIGDIAHDKTQYANNGTLINSPQWVDGFNFTPSIINIVASYIINSQETVFDTVEIELGEPIGNLHFDEEQTIIMSGHGLLEGVNPGDYDFKNSRTFYIYSQLLNNQNLIANIKSDNFEIPELPANINHNFEITYKLEILTNDNNPDDNQIEKQAEIWVADFQYGENNYNFSNKGAPLWLIGKMLTIDGLGSFYIYSGDLFDLISDLSTQGGLCYGMASSPIVYKNNPESLPGYPGNTYTYQLIEWYLNVEYNIRVAFRQQKIPLLKALFYDHIHNHHTNSARELSNIKDKLELNKLVVGSYEKHATVVHTLIKSGSNYFTYDYDNNYNPLGSDNIKNEYVPHIRGHFEEINDEVEFLSTYDPFFFHEPNFSLNSSNFNRDELIDPSILDSLMNWELDSLIINGQNLLIYQENETELMDSSYIAEITIQNGLIESYDLGSYKSFYIDNSIQPDININAENNGSFSIMGINTSSGYRDEVNQFVFENISLPDENSTAIIPSTFSSGDQICQIDYDNDGTYDDEILNSYNGEVPSAENFPPNLIHDLPILNFRSDITQNSINLLDYLNDESPELLNYSLDFNESIFDAYIDNDVLFVLMLQSFSGFEIINLTVSDDLYSIVIPVFARMDDSPPSAPTDVQINISGNDIILTWSEVTTTIYGSPIEVDFYIIYGSEDPYSDFIYLNSTSDTTFIHNNVNLFSNNMFYYIEAFIGSREQLERYINDNSIQDERKYFRKKRKQRN